MFDKTSDSQEVAYEVFRLGLAHGDIVDGCSQEEARERFIAQYPSANTIGGWINAVREYGDSTAPYIMAFVCVQPYLRELFTDDVIADYLEIGATNLLGGILIRYCLEPLPDHLDALIPPIDPEVIEQLDADPRFAPLKGQQV